MLLFFRWVFLTSGPRPPTPPAPPNPPPTVLEPRQCMVMLDGLDSNLLLQQMEAFKSDFAGTLAGAIGWAQTRIVVETVVPGSVVATTNFMHSQTESSALEAFINKFKDRPLQVLGTAFTARCVRHTCTHDHWYCLV